MTGRSVLYMRGETTITVEVTTSDDKMGALAFAIDALREDMGLTIPDLADHVDMAGEELWLTVNGYMPLTRALAAALLHAMADIYDTTGSARA